MKEKEQRLLKAKCELYSALLDMPNDYLEKYELDLISVLAKDIQIQKHLSNALKG